MRQATTIVLVKKPHRIRRAVPRIIQDEASDLYVLAAAAFIFTILGVTGVSSLAQLASMILALLAVLELSQIRSRHQVATIARAQRVDPLAVLRTDFPADLLERVARANDLLMIGTTMSRTVQGAYREDMRRMLVRGGRIRVLLLDPSNEELVQAVSKRHSVRLSPDRLMARIEGTLEELSALADSTGGMVELRVASFAPAMSVGIIDAESPDGLLIAQHNEYQAAGEPAPIICLNRTEAFWFSHFLGEANRLWEDGTPWPLSSAQILSRSPHPSFRDAFGSELEQSMEGAHDILITGVARNALLTSNYGKFEAWLRKGCRIRFLLVNPAASATVMTAAERYYAQRSPDTLRERIKQSLNLLDELQRSTHAGSLSIRLTSYPLATGIIATDSIPDLRSSASAIFAEYYTYQAAGEPKFTLTPADSKWYENLLGEAEAIWANAIEYPERAGPDDTRLLRNQ
jgi:hypothetical protein